jgi:serine protease Do
VRKMKTSGWLAATAVGLIIAGGATAAGMENGAANADARASFAPAGGPPSFASVFQKVSPAVVSIEVTLRAGPSDVAMRDDGAGGDHDNGQAPPVPFPLPGQGQGGGQGWSFRQIVPGQPEGRDAPRQHAAGSGFFISATGYLVTNNHVVENADSISVHTIDGRVLKARLIGRDPATDLAVIKVDGGVFPYVGFADAAMPRVGDWVVAIGNPFGLGGTATAGIVSALGRENIAQNSLINYMQIDAPINRGNSGGPTFDVNGRVVGVNTAIFSPSGGSVGIGFDIPADVAKSISSQLISYGKVDHGYIGATIQPVTADVADSLGLSTTHGALVAGLKSDGPSERAGIHVGDLIEAVDGQAVTSASDLTRKVAFAHPGDTLRLTILRDGREQTVDLRAGLRPSETTLAGNAPDDGAPSAPGADATPSVLGMKLAPLTPADRQRFNIAENQHGVVVRGVGQDSDAGDKGLKAGDLIVKAGERAANAPADVSAAVEQAKRENRKAVLLLVNRGGQNLFVPLKVTPDAKG